MTQEAVMAPIDPRELRHAFGTFATGVTVVTCRSEDGVPHGATVNAFTAVSLDPPLAGLYQHLIQAHTLIEDVGPIAQEAGVKSLVLSHLVPGNRPDSVWEACRKGFDGQLIIGHDLDVIGVGSAK